jgi:hypothetical protein
MSAKLYYIAPLVFECQENPITLADDKFRLTVPYDGEILGALSGPAITGHIANAGTGAGSSTDIQISNVTTGRDYFATEPTFEVDDKDASGRALLSGGMLNGRPTFRQNDVLALDVDALPTNSDSAQMTITLLCGFWREVD